MPKACIRLLLAAACLPLTGCYYMWPTEEPMRKVPAEYPHLHDVKIAVVVRTMQSTELEDPDLVEDLERMVIRSLSQARELRNLTFVSQHQVSQHRKRNLYATETDVKALNMARQLGADMLLWLHVDHYVLGNPMRMHDSFMQGRLTANCRLIDCTSAERRWEKPDLTVHYPPKKSTLTAANPANLRRQLLELFGTKLTDCFRQHKEPIDD